MQLILMDIVLRVFFSIQGTPKVTLQPDPIYPYHFVVPYLSNLNVSASIQLKAEFPPILEVKWQKIHGSTSKDINITSYSKYDGSTVDKKSPRLFLYPVTFEDDYSEGTAYRCLARNSEGWGTSYNRSIWVKGSRFSVSVLLLYYTKTQVSYKIF